MSSQAAAQPDVPVDRLMREQERWGSRAGWASLGGERTEEKRARSTTEIHARDSRLNRGDDLPAL